MQNKWLGLFLAAMFLLLFLCGCGGGSTALLPPSALTYTNRAALYTKAVAITSNNPTSSGGAVASYAVSPALPSGLSLNSSTGVINGTPTAIADTKAYTVTASNSAGSITATLSITVNDSAPTGLSYSSTPVVYSVGYPIAVNTPTITGGAAVWYTAMPTLPWGLNLDPSTGVISGTPTVVTRKSNYTVTASNTGGSFSGTVSIAIANAAPADLSYGTNPAIYVAGVSIQPNIPSNLGGDPTSYFIASGDMPLPAGLNLDASSGIISGTPSAATPAADYKVTASNAAGGLASIPLNITVAPQSAAILAYTPSTLIATKGESITPLTPITTGGAATYTVHPALPTGLSLNASTGIISGTPGQSATTVTYTVTASTALGDAAAKLSLTVDDVAPWTQSLPNMNQLITPLAPANSRYQQLNPDLPVDPAWLASHAATSIVSPDGNTLLIVTSGYNRFYDDTSYSLNTFNPGDSMEYVFIYDISTGTPIKQQVVPIPITYHGIVWDPTSTAMDKRFYVSGCTTDNVHTISWNDSTKQWGEELDSAQHPALAMAHGKGNGLNVEPPIGPVTVNEQVFVYPCAAGLALSKDGNKLVIANYFNDSLSVFTGGHSNWQPTTPSQVPEIDLRPGRAESSPTPGIAGGEYPFWVLVAGDGSLQQPYTAYVSSIRDREIDVVNLSLATPQVTDRISVKGQPNKMTMNKLQTLLYVAEDQTDTIDVIDLDSTHTTVNTIIETIPVIAPAGLLPPSFYYSNSNATTNAPLYTGANTNSVTLSPDETRLYVTNGNLNNVAVVALNGTNSDDQVIGLIPTGWYPNTVSLNAAGTMMYVANAKSPTGANTGWCYSYGPAIFTPNCYATNQYNPQLTKAGLQSFPVPTNAQLTSLTAQVATNNHFSHTESKADAAVMAAVNQGVKHVIFIIKENRTYDQVLGDLVNAEGMPIGNRDPALVQWGEAITPNLHSLARNFVTLDNFMATAEVSYDGWLWTTSARAPDVVEHQYPLAYSYRGLGLDSEGVNRSVNVGLPTVAARVAGDPLTPNDMDLLPGQTDTDAPDGPNGEVNTGYLWNAAMRTGLTVRNYGFFVDTTCYNASACQTPLLHDPAATHTVVAIPTNVALAPYTDPYYRGFDNHFPDYYRFKEWEREFDLNYASGGLPSLSLVRLMHDHTGDFDSAIDMVNTPEVMQADNDYAVGLLIQKISSSIYAQDTLVFVVEDDAQDGADHVDSHRTVAFVAGAYVKQGAVVSTAYNTIDLIRTMEEVLGIKQWLNMNDALANPMADIFNTTPSPWKFTATPSAYLYATQLPLPAKPVGMIVPRSTHDAKYWARVTKGMDFSDADEVDPVLFNRILWKGMMGTRPYPAMLNKPTRRHDNDDDRSASTRQASNR